MSTNAAKLSSFEHLDTLRERNKDQLEQLSDLSGRLLNHNLNVGSSRTTGLDGTTISSVTVKASQGQCTGGCESIVATLNDRRGDTVPHLSDRGQAECLASTESVSLVTLPGGELGQARAALSRPRAQTTTEIEATSMERNQEEAVATWTDLQRTTQSFHSGSQDTQCLGSSVYSGLLQDQGNQRLGQARQAVPRRPKSTLPFQNRELREVGRVTFQDQDQEQDRDWVQDEERHLVRPLLGYDWIAGLLDAETSLTERSEQFFTELRTFRKVNREECVYTKSTGAGEDVISPPELSLTTEERNSQLSQDTHQCMYCYRINSRLFPAPLDPQSACPVCKVPKSLYPNSEPAVIRVSIPRSALLPAHRYRAHRRRSFDSSDSLGLPSHCMLGWSNGTPTEAPQFSSLDLRSYLAMSHSIDGPDAQPKQQPTVQSKLQIDVPNSILTVGQRSEELIDASRLARYRFQRLAPNQTKPHNSAYSVY